MCQKSVAITQAFASVKIAPLKRITEKDAYL